MIDDSDMDSDRITLGFKYESFLLLVSSLKKYFVFSVTGLYQYGAKLKMVLSGSSRL